MLTRIAGNFECSIRVCFPLWSSHSLSNKFRLIICIFLLESFGIVHAGESRQEALPPEPRVISAKTSITGNSMVMKITGDEAKQIFETLRETKPAAACRHAGIAEYVERNQNRVICTKSLSNLYTCDLTYSLESGILQKQQAPCALR